MEMRNSILASILFVSLLCASQARADTDYYYSGHSCKTDIANSAVLYSSNGIYNSSSSASANIWCPVYGNQSNTVDMNGASFSVYNASTSATISCYIYIRDNAGGYYISGWADSVTGHTGYTEAGWPPSQLPNAGASISNVTTYAFYCTLPSSSTGTFFFRSYGVGQLNP
jgi:hypothetical protein